MKNLKYILPVLALAVSLVSCDGDFFESTVEVDIPPHETSLAVSAIFTQNQARHEVFVSNSLGILDKNQHNAVEGATVLLESANDEMEFAFDPAMGIYVYPDGNGGLLHAGEAYTISVNHPDFPTATATINMPHAARIISFTHEPNGTIDEEGYEVDEFTIEVEDLSPEVNYYVFEIAERTRYINGTDTTYVYDPVSSLVSRDPLVRKGYSDRIYEGLPMISDATFNGQTYQLQLYTYDKPTIGNELVIQCYSVNKARFDYLASLLSYLDNKDNPFSEPVNVISNIQNGLGIFALQSKDEMVVKVE